MKRNRHPLGDDPSAGFTLLEVMIAVAILAITLTVLYGSQSQSLSLAAEAKFNTRAALLLQQKIAELEAGLVELQNAEGDFEEEYPDFHWQIEVEDIGISDIEILSDLQRPLQRVRLTILWADSAYTHAADYYIQERE